MRSWLDDGRLERRKAASAEIAELLQLADRQLADAAVPGLSPDGRFVCAYEAGMTLATTVLRAAGYRARGSGHHAVTFAAFGEIMGTAAERSEYLEACRIKRNRAVYHRARVVSEEEAAQLLAEARALRQEVDYWLRANYPGFVQT